ncbi:MAG: hypothetical protein IJV14_05130 [Lachnospiraceae bacterium]|nr:hypothetical protein [Lachnospiraceae bacterium]MBQ9611955.1 hypothetical protein [Lachnospiraceae bacterium]
MKKKILLPAIVLSLFLLAACGSDTSAEPAEDFWEEIPEDAQVISEEPQEPQEPEISEEEAAAAQQEEMAETIGSLLSGENGVSDNAKQSTGSGSSVLSSPVTLYYSSGAGGWESQITINPDWTFNGSFHDSEMGASGGPEYYTCQYSGQFSDIQQLNEYTYSLHLDPIIPERPIGDSWMEDEVKYIESQPNGIVDNSIYYLYLPGAGGNVLAQAYQGSEKLEGGALSGYSLYSTSDGSIFWATR